jgi:hypothetical protein
MIPRDFITMEGRLAECYLFHFNTPLKVAKNLLPAGIEPLIHRDRAILGIVLTRIEKMRPRGFPRFAGVSYWHLGYRYYVKARTGSGEEMEGLYFFRSDCDSGWIAMGGQQFSRFDFRKMKLLRKKEGTCVRFEITAHDAQIQISIHSGEDPGLPLGSVFKDRSEADRILKYKPAALSVFGEKLTVLQVHRNESEWHLDPVRAEFEWPMLEHLQATHDRSYRVRPIDYAWERARYLPLAPSSPSGGAG